MNKKLAFTILLSTMLISGILCTIVFFFYQFVKPKPGVRPDLDIATTIEINETIYGDESDKAALTDKVEDVLFDIGYQGSCIIFDSEISDIKYSATWFIHLSWDSSQDISIKLPEVTQATELKPTQAIVLGENESAFQILINEGGDEWNCWAVKDNSLTITELLEEINLTAELDLIYPNPSTTNTSLQISYNLPEELNCSVDEIGQGGEAPLPDLPHVDNYEELNDEVKLYISCEDANLIIIKEPHTPKSSIYFEIYDDNFEFSSQSVEEFRLWKEKSVTKVTELYEDGTGYFYHISYLDSVSQEGQSYLVAENGFEYFIGIEMFASAGDKASEIQDEYEKVINSIQFLDNK